DRSRHHHRRRALLRPRPRPRRLLDGRLQAAPHGRRPLYPGGEGQPGLDQIQQPVPPSRPARL
ncbi:MAG: hypothetical protein AVDCRST_MAG91-3188, partial [uncultured Sphingomonadaceae bacterium]